MKKRLLRVALILCLFLFMIVCATAESSFVIHFIDVGQADAAVVLCDGEVLMIDGGNTADSSLIFSYLRNTLGLDYIDCMIGTHAHEDHIGGLSGALNACTVGKIYSPVTEYDSRAFRSFKKYADKQGCGLTVPVVGNRFHVGSAEVCFYSPAKAYESTNDNSIVVRIVYGDTTFLFTGDAEWAPEHDMVESGFDLSATLLKVGHHGSSTSSSYVFLRAVMPQYAVISVGKDNPYDHPSESVLSRLHDAGATVYRTDTQGHIICHSDGKQLFFDTEKEGTNTEGRKMPTETAIPTVIAGTAPFVGNRNSKKFHYADCASVADMKDKNKVPFSTKQDALDAGYKPCGRCSP